MSFAAPLFALLRGLVVPCLLLAGMPGAGAATLGDPTKPPNTVLVDSASALAVGEAPPARLQLVKLPKEGRPVAVIDGKVVPLGGYVGEARLVNVTAREVVLRGPQGVERLTLAPDVDKRLASPDGRRGKEK